MSPKRLRLLLILLLLPTAIGHAQRPELVVQMGHSEAIGSVAITPDGRLLASGSGSRAFSPDGKLLASVGSVTIKLWDVASGQELRTLTGDSPASYNPDTNSLIGSDATIELWDVASGQLLRTLSGHSPLAFSPDGKLLASGSGGMTIPLKLWDVASGKELQPPSGGYLFVRSATFSPDGKLLAGGTSDGTVTVWDVASRRMLKTISGHTHTVTSIAFSPDGKWLVSGSNDRAIKLWDVSSGKIVKALSGHDHGIASVSFSPDGKSLSSSGFQDKTIKLWDVASGSELRSLTGHSSEVSTIVFSRDGRLLASGSADKTIKLWDVASGKILNTLASHSNAVRSVAFSPDGKIDRVSPRHRKVLAIASSGATIRFWDFANGQVPRTLFRQYFPIALSPDWALLASGSGNLSIPPKLWDVANGKELRTLSEAGTPLYEGSSAAFSPDGKLLAVNYSLASIAMFTTGTGSKEWVCGINVWDVASGRGIGAFSGHFSDIRAVAFSPDSELLASGSDDMTVKLWNVASGRERSKLSGHADDVTSVAFSPDGKLLASGSSDKTIKLWDVASGQILRTLAGHSNGVLSVTFSPDGKALASASRDANIKLWDVASGQMRKTLSGHSDGVRSVAFSPDGILLMSGSYDATTRVWEVNSGKQLATLISLDQNDWLVSTPDGLFDGSPAAWNNTIWRFNNNTFDHAPIEAFFHEFFYPGLLTDIFAGKRPKALSDISQKDRRQPSVKLTIADSQADKNLSERNLKIEINVAELAAEKEDKTGSGARDVRLFRNASLVKVWRGDVLKGQSSVTLEATIPIGAGENKLTAYAFNRHNIKSRDAELIVTGANNLRREGTAYILSIGIDKYANRGYDLKYAVADAEEFAAEIKRQQESLKEPLKRYAKVEVIPLLDAQATKANITQGLAELAKKVQPEDAVIVFFAGHGTAQGNQFYLIPHDLGYRGRIGKLRSRGLKTILDHSISDRELEVLFEGIDAGQLLLVIDACNSGQALEAEEKRRGPMNSKGLAQLAYEKGMYVMTASQSSHAAKEASKFGHGYLTHALVVEGLRKGSADREPANGSIDIREWLNFAIDEVPKMQENNSREALRGRSRYVNFVGDGRRDGIPKTEAGIRDNIQRPRVFYRRELEANPLVVGAVGGRPAQ